MKLIECTSASLKFIILPKSLIIEYLILSTKSSKSFPLKLVNQLNIVHSAKLMHVMIFRVVVVVIVLQAWNNYRHRAFDVNRLCDVARHRDVLFVHDWNMANLLHKHWNLLLDGDLTNLALIPIADVIRRARP